MCSRPLCSCVWQFTLWTKVLVRVLRNGQRLPRHKRISHFRFFLYDPSARPCPSFTWYLFFLEPKQVERYPERACMCLPGHSNGQTLTSLPRRPFVIGLGATFSCVPRPPEFKRIGSKPCHPIAGVLCRLRMWCGRRTATPLPSYCLSSCGPGG